MKAQTRFSVATMALAIAGIAPAFAEVTTPPATAQASTSKAASTTTTASVTTATGVGAATTPPTTTTTMSKGQTNIATSLAKAQLTQYGITQPTPEQLSAALNGGKITVGTGTGTKTVQLQGVRTQRAAGQGWGQIANGMGVKLGTVVSGMKSKHHDSHEVEGWEHGKHITTAHGGEHHSHKESKHITQAGGEAEHRAHDSHKHITTAAGASGGVYSREHGKHHNTAVATAGGKAESGHHEHSKRYGAGIVTASGGSYVATKHSQHHQGHGEGIVTASSAGSSGAGQGHSDEGSKHGKNGK